MYKVKFYLRLFWFLIPIRTAGVFNFNQYKDFLKGFYKIKKIKEETLNYFAFSTVGKTMIISGSKKYNFGIRMRVERI